MPLHTYRCPKHGERDVIRQMNEGDLQHAPCPACSAVMEKVWRMDTIGMFNTISAQVCEPYYNEQLGQVVRKNRELEDCQPVLEAAQAKGKPLGLDWK